MSSAAGGAGSLWSSDGIRARIADRRGRLHAPRGGYSACTGTVAPTLPVRRWLYTPTGPSDWIATQPRNTDGSPMAAARLSVKNWPRGARVTSSGWVLAAPPVELNASSRTVIGAEPGFDSANRDWLFGDDAASMCANGSGSTRTSSGENPSLIAPLSGNAGSRLAPSTIRACAVTDCGVVITR